MSQKLDSIRWCCILGHIYAIKPLLELHVFENISADISTDN